MALVYEFQGYRDYLRAVFPQKGSGRGRRVQLAQRVGCQTSLVALVLTDRAHFSEDSLFKVGQFLELNNQETEFLLLLFHYEKASNKELKHHYESKMSAILKQRSEIGLRVGSTKKSNIEIQAKYFSDWKYAAIQALACCEDYRSAAAIAGKLMVSEIEVQRILDFLLRADLIAKKGGVFSPGEYRIHLDKKSEFINQHHTNWHMEAIRAISRRQNYGLNYSGVITLAKSDLPKIKLILLDVISKIEKEIKPSPDQEIAGLVIDFFGY